MKRIVFFLMIAFVFKTGGSFAQKALGARESFHYYFRIDGDTLIENSSLLQNYLKLFYNDAFQKASANEFERAAYVEKKKAELTKEVRVVDFTKPYLLPVFPGEISDYDKEKGGFRFKISLRDSIAKAISGKTIFYFNNIININEFNKDLFFTMDSVASVKFIKSIKNKKGIPNRAVRFYCYYSLVDQKLRNIPNRNYNGMERNVDVYLRKIEVRASGGKRFTFLPNEKWADFTTGYKTLTGKEYYYYKLNGPGNSNEFLCSKNDAWYHYTVVEKKEGKLINPVLTFNRNGDTTATEHCSFYYPTAYELDGVSRYEQHVEYGPPDSSGVFWNPRTYIANYRSGTLEGAAAYYTLTPFALTPLKLSLIRLYENGKGNSYTISCKEDFVDAVYLYDNDKEVSRRYYMKANQETLPDEVKKLFNEYQRTQ